MADDDKFPVKLTVAICAGVAVVVGGYLLWFYREKAKGLDFQERLSHATAKAREVAGDAELQRADIYYVSSSGHVELPNKGVGSKDTHPIGIEFSFRSASRADTPAARGQLGGPASAGNGAGAQCIIRVSARGPGTRGGDDLRVVQLDSMDEHCGESLPTAPRCSLAQVWSTAIVRGAPRDALADIHLATTRGKRHWDFEIIDWNKPGGAAHPEFASTIDDDCAP